ncbi:MAG TPA: hypothetical protein VFJ12_04460 [Segeticoccus sp.]|nr:hypothetical protein [Segeticoccus sp.]
MTQAPVIAVVGASGGVGTSTLTAAVAVRAATARRPVVAVDAEPLGGGLDVVFGLECAPGLRWPDLHTIRGRVDGEDLVARLPAAADVPVLSFNRLAGPAPTAPVSGAVLAALASGDRVAVVDAGRGSGPLAEQVLSAAHTVVLLVGNGVHDLAAAQVATERLTDSDREAWLVVRCARRTGGWDSDDGLATVAEALGLPLLASFGDESAVEADLLHGIPPGERPRSALGRAADRVLAGILLEPDLPEAS